MSGGCSEEGSGLPRPLPWGQPGRRRRGAGRGEECWAARPAGAADQHHGQGPSGASRPGPGRAAGSGQREPGTGTWPPAGRGRTLRGGRGGEHRPVPLPEPAKHRWTPYSPGTEGARVSPAPEGTVASGLLGGRRKASRKGERAEPRSARGVAGAGAETPVAFHGPAAARAGTHKGWKGHSTAPRKGHGGGRLQSGKLGSGRESRAECGGKGDWNRLSCIFPNSPDSPR